MFFHSLLSDITWPCPFLRIPHLLVSTTSLTRTFLKLSPGSRLPHRSLPNSTPRTQPERRTHQSTNPPYCHLSSSLPPIRPHNLRSSSSRQLKPLPGLPAEFIVRQLAESSSRGVIGCLTGPGHDHQTKNHNQRASHNKQLPATGQLTLSTTVKSTHPLFDL